MEKWNVKKKNKKAALKIKPKRSSYLEQIEVGHDDAVGTEERLVPSLDPIAIYTKPSPRGDTHIIAMRMRQVLILIQSRLLFHLDILRQKCSCLILRNMK